LEMREENNEPVTSEAKPSIEKLRLIISRRAEEPSEPEKWLTSNLRLIRIQREPIELWVAMGRERDYILIPDSFCSCPHFTIRVARGQSAEPCYHLVAARMAQMLARFHDLADTLSRDERRQVIIEVLYHGRSSLLRRKLYRISETEG